MCKFLHCVVCLVIPVFCAGKDFRICVRIAPRSFLNGPCLYRMVKQQEIRDFTVVVTNVSEKYADSFFRMEVLLD